MRGGSAAPGLSTSRLAIAGGLGLAAAAAFAPEAQATDFPVSNLAASGSGSLADAITQANGHAGADRILFSSGLTGSIVVSGTPLPAITGPTEIVGPGAGQLAIDGNNAVRELYLKQTVDNDPVSISGLTLTHGHPSGAGPSGSGGGILDINASLTLSNVVITDNVASSTPFGGGGGIRVVPQGVAHPSLTILSSTISGNQVPGAQGGAIYSATSGPVVIENTTISGNSAKNGGAGFPGQGTITIQNSAITGNSASVNEAGLEFPVEAPVLIENTTVANNHAAGFGGGLDIGEESGAPQAVISNSTISGNSAAQPAAGIYDNRNYTDAPHLLITNSIVAGNTGTFDLASGGMYPQPIDTSFSLIGNPKAGSFTDVVPGSNLIGVDPQLGPLADNGGATQTLLPASSSPAIDAGSSTLTTDQRGELRPVDFPGVPSSTAPGANAADIGAVELQSPPAQTPTCQGKTATLVGTDGKDRLKGTKKADVIVALGGNDTVLAGAGNDLVCGGAGNDTLKGGPGNDKLFGGPGKDKLFGGPGKDKLKGGPGKDALNQGPR